MVTKTKHYGKIQALEPSKEAKHRLRIIEWYEARGRNAALTCRHFGLSRDTAHAAAAFLDTIVGRMPFPVKAIQVDGGSEFMAQFEDACKQRGIRLFVLPPRSPKL